MSLSNFRQSCTKRFFFFSTSAKNQYFYSSNSKAYLFLNLEIRLPNLEIPSSRNIVESFHTKYFEIVILVKERYLK